MSKQAGLQAAHELLTVGRTHCARHHLLGWTRHPDDQPREIHLVTSSLLLVELEDHLHNLAGMAEACRHGLAGTVPDEYYLSPEDFNPWALVQARLTDEFLLPVGTLSPALRTWLAAQPEQERSSTAKLQVIMGDSYLFWVKGEDGRLRPPTEVEQQRAPETEMLRSLEQTFFALTYADDLAEVAELVATRGSLQRILDLVV